MVCPQLQRLPAWSSAGPYVVVKSTRSDEEVSGEDHSHPPEERTGAKIQWKCSEDTHAHTHLHTRTHTHTHTVSHKCIFAPVLIDNIDRHKKITYKIKQK